MHSVGVQRQYTGTAGRIENAQVAVYLTYAAPRGHALIDRALYCRAAGPRTRIAVTTPESQRQTGVSRPNPRWRSLGHPRRFREGSRSVGGRRRGLRSRPRLRAAIRGHGLGYVLAIAANRRVPTQAGPIRVDRLPAQLPARAWQKHSAGAGSHGHRYYSWAWIALLPEDDADTGRHHLLIRRNDATGELAYLRCYSPRPVTLHTLVAWRDNAGGSRNPSKPPKASPGWTSTRSGAGPPGTAGPPWPCSPTRSWPWPPPPNATPRPTPAGLIALTVNEFRRLFDALLLVTRHTLTTLLAWSRWRRRHQYRARLSHYQRREHQ